MCLAAVYVKEPGQSGTGEPYLADVARVECSPGTIVLTTLLGESATLEAEVRRVDLMKNEIVLEKRRRGTDAPKGSGPGRRLSQPATTQPGSQQDKPEPAGSQ